MAKKKRAKAATKKPQSKGSAAARNLRRKSASLAPESRKGRAKEPLAKVRERTVQTTTLPRTSTPTTLPRTPTTLPRTTLPRTSAPKTLSRTTLPRKPSEPGRASNSRDEKKATARPPSRRIKAAELTKIRQLLAQKKISLTNHLQTELSELEKPEKRHRTDLEEIASDTHDTDSLCEIMDIEATQIGQIDMALAKIDNGTYGICEDCGGEIPLVRLQALPFATQCIECRRKAEIQGQISASDTRMA